MNDAEGPGTALARTEACLDRIARLDPALRAFIAVGADSARAAARTLDAARGAPAGPLHGLPVAIKDCIDVAGVPTTNGSSFFGQTAAAADAPVVRRLKAAGAVILGKTNMHELAYGGTTQNAFFGACRNPWDTARIPGGSSGGSAVAVAAGLAEAALGSDTGSSIRMPAAFCGVAGFRPSAGTVPADGVLPVSPPHDIVGPMARTVSRVARIQAVIADPAPAAALAGALDRDVAGLRLAVPDDFFFDEADPPVAAAVIAAAQVLEQRGARLVSVAIPGAAEAQAHLMPVLFADAASFHRERIETRPEGFSAGVLARLRPGLDMRAVDYARSLRWLEAWRLRVAAFFRDEADAMLTPSVPVVAPEAVDDANLTAVTSRISRFAWVWSAAGAPALSVPCGFVDGLPVGLQVAAGPGDDATVLAIGHRYQKATGWHLIAPPVG